MALVTRILGCPLLETREIIFNPVGTISRMLGRSILKGRNLERKGTKAIEEILEEMKVYRTGKYPFYQSDAT